MEVLKLNIEDVFPVEIESGASLNRSWASKHIRHKTEYEDSDAVFRNTYYEADVEKSYSSYKSFERFITDSVLDDTKIKPLFMDKWQFEITKSMQDESEIPSE